MSNSKSKVAQAQNSVEAAQNAVGQAEDHPSGRMEGQAERSIRHATSAVAQAERTGDAGADQAAQQLAETKDQLS